MLASVHGRRASYPQEVRSDIDDLPELLDSEGASSSDNHICVPVVPPTEKPNVETLSDDTDDEPPPLVDNSGSSDYSDLEDEIIRSSSIYANQQFSAARSGDVSDEETDDDNPDELIRRQPAGLEEEEADLEKQKKLERNRRKQQERKKAARERAQARDYVDQVGDNVRTAMLAFQQEKWIMASLSFTIAIKAWQEMFTASEGTLLQYDYSPNLIRYLNAYALLMADDQKRGSEVIEELRSLAASSGKGLPFVLWAYAKALNTYDQQNDEVDIVIEQASQVCEQVAGSFSCVYPGSDRTIPESVPQTLTYLIEEERRRAEMRPKANEICQDDLCEKPKIFWSQSGRNCVRITCNAPKKCVLFYHKTCWRRIEKRIYGVSGEYLMGQDCPTVACDGLVIQYDMLSGSGGIRKSFSKGIAYAASKLSSEDTYRQKVRKNARTRSRSASRRTENRRQRSSSKFRNESNTIDPSFHKHTESASPQSASHSPPTFGRSVYFAEDFGIQIYGSRPLSREADAKAIPETQAQTVATQQQWGREDSASSVSESSNMEEDSNGLYDTPELREYHARLRREKKERLAQRREKLAATQKLNAKPSAFEIDLNKAIVIHAKKNEDDEDQKLPKSKKRKDKPKKKLTMSLAEFQKSEKVEVQSPRMARRSGCDKANEVSGSSLARISPREIKSGCVDKTPSFSGKGKPRDQELQSTTNEPGPSGLNQTAAPFESSTTSTAIPPISNIEHKVHCSGSVTIELSVSQKQSSAADAAAPTAAISNLPNSVVPSAYVPRSASSRALVEELVAKFAVYTNTDPSVFGVVAHASVSGVSCESSSSMTPASDSSLTVERQRSIERKPKDLRMIATSRVFKEDVTEHNKTLPVNAAGHRVSGYPEHADQVQGEDKRPLRHKHVVSAPRPFQSTQTGADEPHGGYMDDLPDLGISHPLYESMSQLSIRADSPPSLRVVGSDTCHHGGYMDELPDLGSGPRAYPGMSEEASKANSDSELDHRHYAETYKPAVYPAPSGLSDVPSEQHGAYLGDMPDVAAGHEYYPGMSQVSLVPAQSHKTVPMTEQHGLYVHSPRDNGCGENPNLQLSMTSYLPHPGSVAHPDAAFTVTPELHGAYMDELPDLAAAEGVYAAAEGVYADMSQMADTVSADTGDQQAQPFHDEPVEAVDINGEVFYNQPVMPFSNGYGWPPWIAVPDALWMPPIPRWAMDSDDMPGYIHKPAGKMKGKSRRSALVQPTYPAPRNTELSGMRQSGGNTANVPQVPGTAAFPLQVPAALIRPPIVDALDPNILTIQSDLARLKRRTTRELPLHATASTHGVGGAGAKPRTPPVFMKPGKMKKTGSKFKKTDNHK
ncbi:hypothetical protein DFJ77DRAFT_506026 [Powellomyces hirtus]|nr:hypothetical protein DFJ77DRAFT_506026 [Powellomyces hirtus]